MFNRDDSSAVGKPPLERLVTTSSRFGDDGGLWALTRDANRSPWAGNTETRWSFSVPIQFWVYSIGRGHKILAFAWEVQRCLLQKPIAGKLFWDWAGGSDDVRDQLAARGPRPVSFWNHKKTNGQGPSEWKKKTFRKMPLIQKDWRLD